MFRKDVEVNLKLPVTRTGTFSERAHKMPKGGRVEGVELASKLTVRKLARRGELRNDVYKQTACRLYTR